MAARLYTDLETTIFVIIYLSIKINYD